MMGELAPQELAIVGSEKQMVRHNCDLFKVKCFNLSVGKIYISRLKLFTTSCTLTFILLSLLNK